MTIVLAVPEYQIFLADIQQRLGWWELSELKRKAATRLVVT
jgi:hypothetical protein